MKLKSILYMLVLLPFLWSCNDEDNIDEIFVSGQWIIANFFTTTDWNDDHNFKPIYTYNDLETLNKMSIIFSKDGTFKGNMINGTFSGNWQANGKDRSVNFTNIQSNGTLSGFNRELINALTNARFYKGDSNYLQLAPEEKDRYVQFAHRQ